MQIVVEHRLLGQRQIGLAEIAEPAPGDAERVPSVGVVVLAGDGCLQVDDGRAEQQRVARLNHGAGEARPQLRFGGGEAHRFLVRRYGGAAAPPLEQHLTLELVHPGIAGLLGEQTVEDLHGSVGVAEPVEGNCPAVTRRRRGISRADPVQRYRVRLEEGTQLGLDHGEAQFEPRRQRRVAVWRMRDVVGDEGDAVLRQRMGLQVGILQLGQQQLLVLEAVEQVEQPLRRPVVGIENHHRALVGRLLHAAGEAKQVAHRHLLAADADADARAVTRADRGGGADQHGGDRLDHRVAHRLGQLSEMAAADMAGLVRQHADDLERRPGLGQQAAVDEQPVAGADEGV